MQLQAAAEDHHGVPLQKPEPEARERSPEPRRMLLRRSRALNSGATNCAPSGRSVRAPNPSAAGSAPSAAGPAS